VSENSVERTGYSIEIERFHEEARVADLAPTAAAHEASQLLLDRPSLPRRLLLQRAERCEITVSFNDPLHRSRTERADQFVFEVGDADIETQSLHFGARQVRAETGSLEPAPELALLRCVAESGEPKTASVRTERLQESSYRLRASNRHHRDALFVEVATAALGERLERELVADAFNEYNRTRMVSYLRHVRHVDFHNSQAAFGVWSAFAMQIDVSEIADGLLVASAARHLREALDAAGYRPAELRHILGGHGGGLAGREPPTRVLRLEAQGDGVASLIRLLVLGQPVSEDRLPIDAALLERAGIAERTGGIAVPLAVVLPYADLLLAFDRPGSGADEVISAHTESEWLAALTPRRPIATALEIGTGGGYHALLTARHADRVVATDISARALSFASFNAAFNAIENVELRRGSFFDPVAGERFDLVISNPPYAVTPESELVYRDSGLARDQVSALVARGAAEAVAPNGFAAVTASWIVDDDLLAAPREWLDTTGCDAWIFHLGTESALAAAVGWNQPLPDSERAERIARWLEYYRAEGIDSVAYGVLVLRRSRAKRPWLRVVRLPRAKAGPRSAAHVERMFRGVDLAGGGAGDPAPGVSLEVRREWKDGAWKDGEAALVCDDGIPFRMAPANGDNERARRLVEVGLLEPAAQR
jgi:methylase of polypeptide subunit release factors